jgi:hypothetical protein
MHPRDIAKIHDTIAGATLILAGSFALIVRLGVLNMNLLPTDLLRAWPVLLIVIGIFLWRMQDSADNNAVRRQMESSRRSDYGR